MSLDPVSPGSAAYVQAGRRVRCDRCGTVHVLLRSEDPDDDSGELFVECCGRLLHAARNHWLTPWEAEAAEDDEIRLS